MTYNSRAIPRGTVLVNIRRERKKEHFILISRGQYKERSLQKNKNKTTLIQKKKGTIIKNLKSKPQQEDSLSALVEEEEPQRWTPWQDPWLYQAQGWYQE